MMFSTLGACTAPARMEGRERGSTARIPHIPPPAQGNSTAGGTKNLPPDCALLAADSGMGLATTLEYHEEEMLQRRKHELHFLPALAAAQQLFLVYLLGYFLGYTGSCSQLNPCSAWATLPGAGGQQGHPSVTSARSQVSCGAGDRAAVL